MKTKVFAIVASAFVASVAFGCPPFDNTDVQEVSATVPKTHNLRLFTNDSAGLSSYEAVATITDLVPEERFVSPTTLIFGYPWYQVTDFLVQLATHFLWFSTIKSVGKNRSGEYP